MNELIAFGILALSNIALIAYIYLNNREVAKERKSLLNAVIAKNAVELRDLKIADKQPEITIEPIDKEASVEGLSEEDFNKFILGENSGG